MYIWGTNNYNAGYTAGELMGQLIDQYKPDETTLNFAVLIDGMAAVNLNDRIVGFKDALEECSQKTGEKIAYVADPFPCNYDIAIAIRVLTDATRRDTNLDWRFVSGGWSLFTPPDTVIRALGRPEKAESLLTFCFDTLPPKLKLIKAGSWK